MGKTASVELILCGNRIKILSEMKNEKKFDLMPAGSNRSWLLA